MNWERCKRCGSSRVIEEKSTIIGLGSLIFGVIMVIMYFQIREYGDYHGFYNQVFLGLGLFLIIFGYSWRKLTTKLYCRDCRFKWIPGKN